MIDKQTIRLNVAAFQHRLPTIEQVKEWFMENRVFYLKSSKAYLRIFTFTENPCDNSEEYIYIGQTWYTIKQFCKGFTHADGSELYINE